MRVSYVHMLQYLGVVEHGLSIYPPISPACYDVATAQRSLDFGNELLAIADECGYDWVSLIEHHYSPRQLTPNPLLAAANMAARLRTAKIAILGSTIPFLNPVRLAEEYAMLDLLSGGRAVVGLLRGTPPEYTTYWVNPAESRGRYEEAVALVLRAWTEPQPFGWEGQYYRYRTVSIWPRPVQQPHPQVFVSGNSAESGSMAARLRLSLALSFQPVPRARQSIAHYQEEAAKAGWTPTGDNVVIRGFVHVAETDAEAQKMADDYDFCVTDGGRGMRANVLEAVTGYSGSRQMHDRDELRQDGVAFIGSPATVFEQMARWHEEVGANTLDAMFVGGRLPYERAKHSLELFGREVLPKVHAL
ncbi:MAG TPA: LLM class flavin-dependent oxidoreductase [Chloroflexota bacterium]|nr:LLM class flavin-dependent oxidoreductase [Chloroflexota bacterium]